LDGAVVILFDFFAYVSKARDSHPFFEWHRESATDDQAKSIVTDFILMGREG
jgi:hypothetical protein